MKKLFTLLLFAFAVSSAMADTELSVTKWQINDVASCSHEAGTNTIVFAEGWRYTGGCQLHALNFTSMAGNYLWIEFAEPTTAKYKIELTYNYTTDWEYKQELSPDAGSRYVCFDISSLAIEGTAYINIQSATNDESELEIAHIYVGEHGPITLYLDEAMNYGWDSTYYPNTETISFSVAWGVRGWSFATARDASGFNVLVCDITAFDGCDGEVFIDYGNDGNADTQDLYSFPIEDGINYLDLDNNRKNHIEKIYFRSKNMASGEGVASTIRINSIGFSIKKDLSTGYASFSAPYPVTIPEGVAVGRAEVRDDRIVVDYVDNTVTVIPANTGVILRGTGSCTLWPTTEQGTPSNFDAEHGNELVATSLYPTPDTGDGNNYYGLLKDEAAFAPITGNPTFSGNKAYIKTSATAGARLVIIDNETTAVHGIENVEATAMGKHLENGRLVIVKNGSKFNAAGQLVK